MSILTSDGRRAVGVGYLLVANLNGRRADLPETSARVNRNAGELASELGLVDTAKEIGTGRIVSQVDRENRHRQLWHDRVEEGGLLRGLDSVQLGEGETNKTIVVGVLDEGLGEGGSKFDGLASGGCAANVDCVFADNASSAGAVTVRDLPSCALQHLERLGLGCVECGVLPNGPLGKSGAKYPPVFTVRW